MAEPTFIELGEQLCNAKTVQEIARIVALLMRECGIHNFQQVGLELARLSVTSGLGKN